MILKLSGIQKLYQFIYEYETRAQIKEKQRLAEIKKKSLKYMNPIFFYIKKTKFKKIIDNKILLCEYSQ